MNHYDLFELRGVKRRTGIFALLVVFFTLLLLSIALPVLADGPHGPADPVPEPPKLNQSQEQDQGQEQAQHQSQTLSGGNSMVSNVIDFDYPRVSAVFGMGNPGYSSAPVSNGPCPLWVQDKPSRSFPGHGRGATYIRDTACWAMTERWLAILEARAHAEADRAAAERARAEACFECEQGK